MAVIELTNENFEKTVAENDILLIDFWASWCGPCRQFAPVFEAAAETHADICFGKIDTENQPDLAGFFEIRSIPTLVAFREQIGIFKQAGALPPAGLEELIQSIKGLDMAEVRKAVEEQGKE